MYNTYFTNLRVKWEHDYYKQLNLYFHNEYCILTNLNIMS